jgi:hypothetical protein
MNPIYGDLTEIARCETAEKHAALSADPVVDVAKNWLNDREVTRANLSSPPEREAWQILLEVKVRPEVSENRVRIVDDADLLNLGRKICGSHRGEQGRNREGTCVIEKGCGKAVMLSYSEQLVVRRGTCEIGCLVFAQHVDESLSEVDPLNERFDIDSIVVSPSA